MAGRLRDVKLAAFNAVDNLLEHLEGQGDTVIFAEAITLSDATLGYNLGIAHLRSIIDLEYPALHKWYKQWDRLIKGLISALKQICVTYESHKTIAKIKKLMLDRIVVFLEQLDREGFEEEMKLAFQPGKIYRREPLHEGSTIMVRASSFPLPNGFKERLVHTEHVFDLFFADLSEHAEIITGIIERELRQIPKQRAKYKPRKAKRLTIKQIFPGQHYQSFIRICNYYSHTEHFQDPKGKSHQIIKKLSRGRYSWEGTRTSDIPVLAGFLTALDEAGYLPLKKFGEKKAQMVKVVCEFLNFEINNSNVDYLITLLGENAYTKHFNLNIANAT